MYIKSYIILLHYANACNELAGPISTSLGPGNTSPFALLQQWQAVCNTVLDLTVQRFEPQASRSRDEHVTARPTCWSMQRGNYLLVQNYYYWVTIDHKLLFVTADKSCKGSNKIFYLTHYISPKRVTS